MNNIYRDVLNHFSSTGDWKLLFRSVHLVIFLKVICIFILFFYFKICKYTLNFSLLSLHCLFTTTQAQINISKSFSSMEVCVCVFFLFVQYVCVCVCVCVWFLVNRSCRVHKACVLTGILHITGFSMNIYPS